MIVFLTSSITSTKLSRHRKNNRNAWTAKNTDKCNGWCHRTDAQTSFIKSTGKMDLQLPNKQIITAGNKSPLLLFTLTDYSFLSAVEDHTRITMMDQWWSDEDNPTNSFSKKYRYKSEYKLPDRLIRPETSTRFCDNFPTTSTAEQPFHLQIYHTQFCYSPDKRPNSQTTLSTTPILSRPQHWCVLASALKTREAVIRKCTEIIHSRTHCQISLLLATTEITPLRYLQHTLHR